MAPSFNSVLTAGLAFTAAVSAVPFTLPSDHKQYSVKQVRNENYVKSGPLALARAYAKFGAPMPKGLAATVERLLSGSNPGRRDTGSVTTNPADNIDSEWLTPVQIGTPPQTLMLDFDTGSSDLWVFSTETQKSEVSGQTLYDPAKSNSSSKLTGATWSITYGDQSSSSGDVYTDVVSVGGLAVKKQAVELAKQVSSTFSSESDLDGLLGLAWSSINTVKPTAQTTFFDTAKSELTDDVFTADLKHQAPGKYNFGYIDSSAYTGSIAYTSVDNSQGFWTFTSAGYGVGDATPGDSPITGIADTGTTLLMLPDNVVKAYYAKVSGAKLDNSQGGYVFPCSASLPDFTFLVESTKITIPGDFMSYSPISSGSSSCFGGLQSSSDIGINIFGDIALKAAFVVFDGGNTRLGWATKDL